LNDWRRHRDAINFVALPSYYAVHKEIRHTVDSDTMTAEKSNNPSRHTSNSEAEQDQERLGKDDTEERESRSGIQGAGTG
jgi:hypothetical protein